MKVGAVIQARMGSSRLPGKVLMPLGGTTVLAYMVTRLRRAKSLDAIVIATSVTPADDDVVSAAEALNIPCFRGSELDVLERMIGAARHNALDVMVRLTADCPLIDPIVVDAVVTALGQADYASNIAPPTFPDGLDTEAVRLACLEAAARESNEPLDHEHVTPFIRRHAERFKLVNVAAPADFSHMRWTLDTAADLAFLTAVSDALGTNSPDGFGWMDVVALLTKQPGLMAINAGARRNASYERQLGAGRE